MNNLKQLLSGSPGARRANQIKMVAVGNMRLRVVIRPGNGKFMPLLLINGIGANIEMFDPFVEALNPNLEVIRFDIPGVGDSPPPVLPQTIMALARLTSRMLDQLGYQQVDALGISWGGALPHQFTYPHPTHRPPPLLSPTSPRSIQLPTNL